MAKIEGLGKETGDGMVNTQVEGQKKTKEVQTNVYWHFILSQLFLLLFPTLKAFYS